MHSTYRVGRITSGQIDAAYLLVNLVAPTLEPEVWRTSCLDTIKRKDRKTDQDEIVVAVNPLGYIQGLCVYAIRRHPAHGRILDVSIFVVTSAADEAGVAIDLLGYLRQRARLEACVVIRIWTLGRDNWSRHLKQTEIDRSDHGVLMILDRDKLDNA